MNFKWIALVCSLLFASSAVAQDVKQQENDLAETFFGSKKIVFLGDSITYHGGFLTTLESCIIANGKEVPQMLNLGLSSETCSGDSEPAHPWPRPNVHERFERLLEKMQPDLLVVNYGMNDGIYHPFDKSRFESYQAGIDLIIDAAAESENDMKVILVTPPPFDAVPVRAKNGLVKKDAKDFSWKAVYENYDSEVLTVYSTWLREQESRVAGCIDLRTPIQEALIQQRKTDPSFHYAHDGVHLNDEGHRVIGNAIAEALGLDSSKTLQEDAKAIIKQRHALLRNSWLSTVGHKRPDIRAGAPTRVANMQSKLLNEKLQKLLAAEKKESK